MKNIQNMQVPIVGYLNATLDPKSFPPSIIPNLTNLGASFSCIVPVDKMKNLCIKSKSSTRVAIIRGNVLQNSKVNAENCQKKHLSEAKARFSSEELARHESLPWLPRIPDPLHERSCSMYLPFRVSMFYSPNSSHESTHLRHPKPLHTP